MPVDDLTLLPLGRRLSLHQKPWLTVATRNEGTLVNLDRHWKGLVVIYAGDAIVLARPVALDVLAA